MKQPEFVMPSNTASSAAAPLVQVEQLTHSIETRAQKVAVRKAKIV